MPPSILASSVLALSFAINALAQSDTCGVCQSFGIDFLSGGTYFQNSNSTDPFTLVQEFEGCDNDSSYNILVDPSGNQVQCSNSPLQPDDTPQLVTCPLDKDQLSTGDWSLLVISNNGNCDPIDFERDFSLTVGPQTTVTLGPTLTVSTVSTPVESAIQTVTQVITSSANPSTTTVQALINLVPTLTVHPLPSITLVTKAVLTVTSTSTKANIVATSTNTATATCAQRARRSVRDPVAGIAATILGNVLHEIGLEKRTAAPAPTARSASTEFKRAIIEGRALEPEAKARFLTERSERLALNKRAPDEQTTTFTAASAVSTETVVISTAPTSTVTGTTTLVQTSTVTPTVTVRHALFGLGGNPVQKVVTAPAATWTNTFFVPATTVQKTTTSPATLTVTSTVTPAALASSCSSVGGVVS